MLKHKESFIKNWWGFFLKSHLEKLGKIHINKAIESLYIHTNDNVKKESFLPSNILFICASGCTYRFTL